MDGARTSEGGDETPPGSIGGKNAGETEGDSEGEPLLDLPFGVTVGSAKWYPGGYVVTAVDARHGGSHAVLAFLDSEVARGSVLDLGRVYGDAEPPSVIIRGNDAFVVVPDTDASGNSYRYGWVHGLDGRSRVEWLGSFEPRVDDSAAYGLANTADTITIVWDEVEPKSHQSHVSWASLDASGKRILSAGGAGASTKRKNEHDWLVNSTSHDTDAEAPQLVAHRSGYWLAYLAGERAKTKGSSVGTSPNVRAKSVAGDEDTRVVELGRRGIEVLSLDAHGRANGKPIRVAERTAHVVTFDIEVTADDGALVAYRDVDATPGVEAQTIEIVRIRPDGGVTRQHIDDERVGAGMPTLLVDPDVGRGRPNTRAAWLAVAGSAGETRLAEIPEQGDSVLELLDAPQLAGVEPLLWQGNSVLVVRHRARFVEFERIACSFHAEELSANPH